MTKMLETVFAMLDEEHSGWIWEFDRMGECRLQGNHRAAIFPIFVGARPCEPIDEQDFHRRTGSGFSD